MPLPLQLPMSTSTPLAHEAEPHVVVFVGGWQMVASVPSQIAPQVAPAPVPPHAERRPCGGARGGNVVQVPALPATSHAWHCPAHRLEQHTPSVHTPLAHSRSLPHGVPRFFVQLPAAPAWLHALPEGQTPRPQHTPSVQ